MTNPLVPLGTLNRLRASIVWASFSNLNISASYLGKEGIRFSPEGESTAFLEAMTGAVTSPEPYQLVNFRIALLKSQSLASAYKQQLELSALVGDCTIRPDASTLAPFQISNCAISNVEPMQFNGEEAIYPILCRGTYYVNSSLFNGG